MDFIVVIKKKEGKSKDFIFFTISLFKYRQYLNFLHAVLIIIYL